MTNILVAFYSSYGHTHGMARAVAEGASKIEGTTVSLTLIPELEECRRETERSGGDGLRFYERAREAMKDLAETTLDDLRWADGVVLGTPTRYGNMCAQLKWFLDRTGQLWWEGAMEDKPAGVFTSTGTVHGGQESTILATMIPLLHLGMIPLGSPYRQNPGLMSHDRVLGGSPYGPGTLAVRDLKRELQPEDLDQARALGERVAKVATRLSDLRAD